MKFLLKQLNSKYNTIINKHKRFILNKIYFVVIHFFCNQYFSLHAYILSTYAFIIIIYNY